MFWYQNKFCCHYTSDLILGSIDLIIIKINATSFSISVFLTLAPVVLLVNCTMAFFFLCNFFISFSLTGIFPNRMFIKTSQMAFSCDLVIVEINAHACFLSLVAKSSRKASCVFTKRPIATEAVNHFLLLYFILSRDVTIFFWYTNLTDCCVFTFHS